MKTTSLTSIQSILLIEDDPFFKISLRDMIDTQAPHEISWTLSDSIQAGLKEIAQSSVDLILLDLNLPDSKGIQTWQTIRKHAPDLPVVIISGDSQCYEENAEFLKDGAQEFVRKGHETERNLYLTLCHAVQRQSALLALQNATTELVENQRLTSLGMLAGGVAHEFNNLNAIIMGCAEMQLARKDIDAACRKAFEKIITAVKHGSDVTKGLLGLARKNEDWQHVDLREIITDTLTLLERTLQSSGIEKDINLPDHPCHVHASPGQIGQVIMNIFMNAIHALTESMVKKISIEVFQAIDDFAELVISDSGCGMSERLSSRIFDPFVTSKVGGNGQPKGMGLGLATSHSIITNHGGSIVCDSAIDHGTTFTIRIPSVAISPPEDGASSRYHYPNTTEKNHILIVDDDPTIRQLFNSYLKGVGYSVSLAKDGEQANELINRQHFDVMILDRSMPILDGIGLLHTRKQERLRTPPTIMYSAWLTKEDIIELTNLGVEDILNKPMSLKHIDQSIRRILSNTSPGNKSN